MHNREPVLTERLDLRPVSLDDLAALFELNTDPDTWQHDPPGRQLSPDQTRAWIERAAAKWNEDGPWIDAHNQASRRVAERLGLVDQGLRPDKTTTTPSATPAPPTPSHLCKPMAEIDVWRVHLRLLRALAR